MNIAIMGATSHIAKGLIDRFLAAGEDNLHLFSRSPEKVHQFIATTGRGSANHSVHSDYRDFSRHSFDVIINCVGVETRNKHNCDFTRYFTVTEEFDNLAMGYLKGGNHDALYVSFSSGAVYGKGFLKPAEESSVNPVRVNHVLPEDYYGVVRLNAEAKHRAHGGLNIVDLRIFSYFSRHINLADGFFITDVMQAILNDRILITDGTDIVRDYLHPDDLFAMIMKCRDCGRINRAMDVSSTAPAAKKAILAYFESEYGLHYEMRDRTENSSATGAKSNYYSTCRCASEIGYVPKFSSMDTLRHEAGYILSRRRAA